MTNFTYKDIEDYVNNCVSAFMTPINNVESVKSKRLNDEVYIELIHESGTARYFNVTGMTISRIGILMGQIITNQRIGREITDREERKEIRRLFR